ncbi:hypothetical protein FKM82_018615 [Ascaphus truei]
MILQQGSAGTPMYLQQIPQATRAYPRVSDMNRGFYHTATGGYTGFAGQVRGEATTQPVTFRPNTHLERRATIGSCIMATQYAQLQQPPFIPLRGMHVQDRTYHPVPGQYAPTGGNTAQIGSFLQTPSGLPITSPRGKAQDRPIHWLIIRQPLIPKQPG